MSADNPPPAQRRAWWLARSTPDVPLRTHRPSQDETESHGLLALSAGIAVWRLSPNSCLSRTLSCQRSGRLGHQLSFRRIEPPKASQRCRLEWPFPSYRRSISVAVNSSYDVRCASGEAKRSSNHALSQIHQQQCVGASPLLPFITISHKGRFGSRWTAIFG